MQITDKSKKLIILILWFGFLLATTVLATNGNPWKLISDFVSEKWAAVTNKQIEVTPVILLKEYTSAYEAPPPIGLVLDSIFVEKSWLNPEYYEKARGLALNEHDQRMVIKNTYFNLFDRINTQLHFIADNFDNNETDDDNRISGSFMIGYPFSDKAGLKRALLPGEVTDWVENEPAHRKKASEQQQLINSFLYIIVLGALGSLIYAIKDITDSDSNTSVISFALRPFFGIFLSIVMFVLFMVTHSLVSVSNASNVRYSTIYVLALAGGLLSDQAYALLIFKLKKWLADYKNKD